MPNDKDGHPGRAQDGKASILKNLISSTVPVISSQRNRMLRNLILSMLPLLTFQRNLLPIFRTALQRDKDDYIRAIDNFVSLELHALMMIFDPTRKLRSHLSEDLEKDLAAGLTRMLENSAASQVTFVEFQEKMLSHLIDVLKEKTESEKPGDTREA
jgi:hypothetical protein